MTKLSIITVCLNEVKMIEKTLKSVVDQTFTDYEYIVIDGGSTDGTLDIINEYRDRIDVFIGEPDTGIYNAMNKGIRKATGEYVSFLNGGDYLCNSTILEDVFACGYNEDIIFGDVIALLSSGQKIRKKTPRKLSKLYMSFDTIPHPGALIKRQLFDKIGLYKENFKIAADYEFFVNALYNFHCSYKYIPTSFAIFNLFGISQTKAGRMLGIKEREMVQRKYFDKSYLSAIFLKKILYNYIYKLPSYAWFFLKGKIFPKYLDVDINYTDDCKS